MTEEYKQNILKYLTNHLESQSGVNEPQYDVNSVESSTLYNDIAQNYDGMIFYAGFVPSKSNKNQSLDYSIIACNGTLTGESNRSGALVIIDKEYNIIATINQYSDGEQIKPISCINVDEKGNYYLIEHLTNSFRIVLLNNLVMKPAGSNQYQAIKIETYTIPSQYSWENFVKIFKNETSNRYFVVGNRNNSAGIVGCEYNVDSNTWNYYTSSQIKQWALSIFDNGYYVNWDENDILDFKIAVYFEGLRILSKGSGTAMTSTTIISSETEYFGQDFIFYSNEVGYYAEVFDGTITISGSTYYVPTISIYKVDLTNNTYNRIANITRQRLTQSTNGKVSFIRKDDILTFYGYYTRNSSSYYVYFGVINGSSVDSKALTNMSADTWTKALLYPNIITEFNKVNVYMVNRDSLYKLFMTWNPSNYNGLPYISKRSLVPQNATLEDENENEIFNRNFYNLTHYSNEYTATMQVPNTYLNNIQLSNACLYSKNNNLLVENPINITKNIYEELNINFINKFNITYENKVNLNASSDFVDAMLNQSINKYIGKYKINYNDKTSEINSLSTYETSTYVMTYKIQISVSKKIDTLEILSQDESIVYQTIDLSNLIVGNTYEIYEEVKIE